MSTTKQCSVEQQQTQQLISELEGMALDPTLDQCCRRDIQSRIHKERIRHSLQEQDRIDARQRAAAAVICRDPQALAAAAPQQQQQHVGTTPEQQQRQHDQPAAASDDDELAELRRQRLQQLQAQAAATQQQQLSGFGTLNDVQAPELKALLAEPPGRGRLVVHLALQGYEPCEALDEILAAAAAQYRGTYFARVVVPRQSPLVAQLQLPHGVPALLVVRHGCLLGKAPVSQFGPGQDIWEEEVLSYLQRLKVLATGDASSSGTKVAARSEHHRPGASDESGTDNGSESAEDEEQTACEICGRHYPHEHVRAIFNTPHYSSDDES